MSSATNLSKLTELAQEKSSERRRTLLREVTDMFFESPPEEGSGLQTQFDAVLTTIATQTAEDARMELAKRMADADNAPVGLVMQLARDAISVAGPILERSNVFSEEDLVRLVHETGQDHMRAISKRNDVTEQVSSAIVERGDDTTVATLISNDNAQLSRETYEEVSRRAEVCVELQKPFVNRAETPPDLLKDLMMVVESSLRDTISKKFDKLDPGVLEAALAASHHRLESRIAQDKEIAEARKFISIKSVRKELDGSLLATLLRESKKIHFCVGFAEMAGIDYLAAQRAIDHESMDGLALVCKAAGFDKSLFVTLAVLRENEVGEAFAKASEYGQAYDDLDQTTADRVIRFWRMRQKAAA